MQESSTTVGIVAIVAATWFSSSFWGALDTAFCRIYHRDCRSWVRQKLFALGMLAVVLLFFVATVSIPALQGFVVRARATCRSGSARCAGSSTGSRWPAAWCCCSRSSASSTGACRAARSRGAASGRARSAAVVAMGIVDYAFPLYLSNVSSLRVGTSFLFVLIVLVWFYALALILLAGAVVNELRFRAPTERCQLSTRHGAIRRPRSCASSRSGASATSTPAPARRDEPDEERQHERRAERAAYLREKLDERAESEERVEGDA